MKIGQKFGSGTETSCISCTSPIFLLRKDVHLNFQSVAIRKRDVYHFTDYLFNDAYFENSVKGFDTA